MVLEDPPAADPTEAFENEQAQPATNYSLLKTFRHDDSGRAAPLFLKGVNSSRKKSRGSASSSHSGDQLADVPKSREASDFLSGEVIVAMIYLFYVTTSFQQSLTNIMISNRRQPKSQPHRPRLRRRFKRKHCIME